VGRKAIEYALEGKSRHMVTLVVPPGPNYHCITSTVELSAVANRERRLPREWIDAQGNHVVPAFLDYARPLIQGEVKIPLEGGLPVYTRLLIEPGAKFHRLIEGR
jgi:6-phosphofructokinase 1